MRRILLSLPLVLVGSAAFAACPDVPDIAAEQDRLLAQVQVAPNEAAARVISSQLWGLWAKAPDARAQDLLDSGMEARNAGDFRAAISKFDELTSYCPDYAESYNQRAFALFLTGFYEAALVELELAIERSPKHVAAISGKALTLMGLGRDDEAQIELRRALEMNPWIPERQFLIEGGVQEL